MTLSRPVGSRVMTPMDPDERSLVARLRAGDTGAFDDVYGAYRPRVFAFLLRMSRSRTVAEDLLDETWLRLSCASSLSYTVINQICASGTRLCKHVTV